MSEKYFNILPSKSALKRVNSGGPSNIESISVFKAGNLNGRAEQVADISDNDLIDEFEEIEIKTDDSSAPLTLEDYKKADKLLSNMFGIPIIESFTKLILNGKLKSKDLVVQALAY